MKKIKALVIDDEASNRRLISKLISQLNNAFEIIGEAASVEEGYTLINDLKPDIIFLDIKMQDGTGFTLLELFAEINFEVVFVTGFDNYAVQAFEFEALDYVIKPINPVKFSKTLTRVELRITNKTPLELGNILKSYNSKDALISKLSLHQGNNVVLIRIEDILHVKSEDRCVVFVTKENERYTSSKDLSDFEFIMEGHPYMIRVNKSMYLNVNFVKTYTKGQTCMITMVDGECVEVPRRKKSEILNLLKPS